MFTAGLGDGHFLSVFEQTQSCVCALWCDIVFLHRLTSADVFDRMPKEVAYAFCLCRSPSYHHRLGAAGPSWGAWQGHGYDNGTTTAEL